MTMYKLLIAGSERMRGLQGIKNRSKIWWKRSIKAVENQNGKFVFYSNLMVALELQRSSENRAFRITFDFFKVGNLFRYGKPARTELQQS